MQKSKANKTDVCCTSHWCQILGILFLVVATVLTLLTFSGIGIFGLFIVGLVFCFHKHWGHTHCSHGEHGCCDETISTTCSTTPHKKDHVVVPKKATTKK